MGYSNPILRLVDRTEAITPCWLWGGSFWGRTPMFQGRLALVGVWEAINEEHFPRTQAFVNLCGWKTCVRLDHWQKVTREQRRQFLQQRRFEEYLQHVA